MTYSFVMKVLITSLLLVVITVGGGAQVVVSGTVTGNKKQPLRGVSVSIKDSYDGTTSDSLGNFRFTTSEKPPFTLTASFVGFSTLR